MAAKVLRALLFLQAILLAAHRVLAITIDMVTVGNPGNAPDTRYNSISVGTVDHFYQIGKYEITAGQYTEFLNAVAKADAYELYDPSMGHPGISTYGANIQRSGASPNYSYTVAPDWANRPVNYVSWGDAARFTNWLHNGQLNTGVQEASTTEDGAYTLNGANSIEALMAVTRNPSARFFIPTEDEWYKAAYHDKSAGLAANYFDFPMGTSAPNLPGNDISEATKPGNNANFINLSLAIGAPFFRTLAAEFELSDSPYGTFDQGGNVSEWSETATEEFLSDTRSLRGGSFADTNYMGADVRGFSIPTYADFNYGFRVAAAAATVPGDFNHDGAGDAADYVVWRKGLGTTYGPSDFNDWRSHFGQTAGSGVALPSATSPSASVPEPVTSTLAFVAICCCGLVASRRH